MSTSINHEAREDSPLLSPPSPIRDLLKGHGLSIHSHSTVLCDLPELLKKIYQIVYGLFYNQRIMQSLTDSRGLTRENAYDVISFFNFERSVGHSICSAIKGMFSLVAGTLVSFIPTPPVDYKVSQEIQQCLNKVRKLRQFFFEEALSSLPAAVPGVGIFLEMQITDMRARLHLERTYLQDAKKQALIFSDTKNLDEHLKKIQDNNTIETFFRQIENQPRNVVEQIQSSMRENHIIPTQELIEAIARRALLVAIVGQEKDPCHAGVLIQVWEQVQMIPSKYWG